MPHDRAKQVARDTFTMCQVSDPMDKYPGKFEDLEDRAQRMFPENEP